MPTVQSIPPELANSILSRWINGQSSTEIVDWIHSSNGRRKEATTTSKSSVTRFIERYASSQHLGSKIPVVRRCRAQASRLLDGLDEVEDELRSCLAESARLDATPECRLRFSARLRALGSLERNLFRRLKLAGVDGKTELFHAELKCDGLAEMDARFRTDAEEDLKAEFGVSTAGKSTRIDSESTGKTWRNDPVLCKPRPPPPGSFQEINQDLVTAEAIMRRTHAGTRQLEAEAAAVPAPRPAKAPVHVEPKVGRNEPCPCGSGAKWKKCHGGANPPVEKKAA